MMIINPGSENKGGSYKEAYKIAREWLMSIHAEGFPEVYFRFKEHIEDGNYVFVFTHRTTKVKVLLETHGFTYEECKKFMFRPRIYWNGSSTGNPKLEDWLTDKFTYRIVYEKKK